MMIREISCQNVSVCVSGVHAAKQKKQTYRHGMTPSRTERKTEFKTAIKPMNGRTECKRQKAARRVRFKRTPWPKKGRGRPNSFLL